MIASLSRQSMVMHKLAAFERLRPEFETAFQFVQEVHGQRRFGALTVADAVRYLHARWLAGKKDLLLSVPGVRDTNDARRCLELLRGWQAGETAGVIAFLQRALDMEPFASLTSQLHAALVEGGAPGRMSRLFHGRQVLLNRGMNLLRLLDAIFALAEPELLRQVAAACAEFSHRPAEIDRQLADFADPVYVYLPAAALARRNMTVMNAAGTRATTATADLPGNRSPLVARPTMPRGPLAQTPIPDYHELTAPWHNNVRGVPFVDVLEPDAPPTP